MIGAIWFRLFIWVEGSFVFCTMFCRGMMGTGRFDKLGRLGRLGRFSPLKLTCGKLAGGEVRLLPLFVGADICGEPILGVVACLTSCVLGVVVELSFCLLLLLLLLLFLAAQKLLVNPPKLKLVILGIDMVAIVRSSVPDIGWVMVDGSGSARQFQRKDEVVTGLN